MSEAGASGGKRHRILLVEDSDIDAELMTIHLNRGGPGYDLIRATRRSEFERALKHDAIDLILADYSLPDFDGLTALEMAQREVPGLPVVFVSGIGGEDLATEALRRGAVDYVVKRNLHRLAGAVSRALAEHEERTRRRAAEAKLVTSEANVRLAMEAAALGLWQYRADETLGIDDTCRRMLGRAAPGDITLADLLGLVHATDREPLATAFRDVLGAAAPPALAHECRIVSADETRWIVIRGRRLNGSEGVDLVVTGVMQDITATRLLESQQRRTEVLFRLAVQATDLGIWEIGPDGETTWVNDAYRQMAGLATGNDYRLTELQTRVVHPLDRAALDAALDAARSGATEDVDLEHRLIRASDGQVVWVAVKGRRIMGIDGRARLVGTVRDVTAQRQLQHALVESNEKLERRVAERTRELTAEIAERNRVEDTLRQLQRLEAVGQLTAGVAHDFNNLLTVVLSNVSLIGKLLQQRQVSDERVTQRLGSMRDAVKRGATLIRQLLAFSRRQRLEPQNVNFNDIVIGMRDILQATLGGSVNLTNELADDVWLAKVDPTQMELIILNLAINARDAMEVGGSLRIETGNMTVHEAPTRPEHPDPGDYAVVSVSDTGSGMTDEVLAKAFEPFFTTKDIGKGSGLGLAQVFGFAKQSGGGVRIDTEVGLGTTVHVYMPRSPDDLRATAALATAADAAGETPPVSGYTLLVVDDDGLVREATASLLEMHGYRVQQAPDGMTALRLLEQHDGIDLALLDFAMPKMNGAELATAIRALHPQLPILFMTGYADRGALGHVPDGEVLQKPVEEAELMERLRERLRGL